jgi:iron complex transport system substrate-binding protein
MKRRLLALCLWGLASLAVAGPTVIDDNGHTVTLAAPARRVVSLGPHLTEIVFAVGGGDTLGGVIRYSDHPSAARDLPVVGDAFALDFEAIVKLRPDLVLVWDSGLNQRHKARLRSLGLTVYESEIRQAQGIADTLRRVGLLLGRDAQGEAAAVAFESRWLGLQRSHAGRKPVRVFWQLWHEPLMTVNREHLISEAMRTCGGVNVFGELPLLTPTISREAAVAADPQLIATSGRAEDAARDFAAWRRFGNVDAVKRNRFATIDGSLIVRMGPRFVDGAQALCDAIDRAR